METISRPIRRLLMAFLAAAAVALLGLATIGLLSSAAQADPTAQASATKVVDISNFKFTKRITTISKGSSVKFVNTTAATPHTATANGGSFDTRTIRPGKSKQVRFPKKGTFAFHCSIHPSMTGKVIVQ